MSVAILTFDENGQLAPVKSFPQAGVLLVQLPDQAGHPRGSKRE
ncbi:phosphopantetheinyl transferase, partial [Pseudomonas syringae pv. actinidifoliorum]|nr:phosphopantetheinyl transferase [Pseudomonas syringae pv. actinidifoliorum]